MIATWLDMALFSTVWSLEEITNFDTIVLRLADTSHQLKRSKTLSKEVKTLMILASITCGSFAFRKWQRDIYELLTWSSLEMHSSRSSCNVMQSFEFTSISSFKKQI